MSFKEDYEKATSDEIVKRNMQIILRHFKVLEFNNEELRDGKDKFDLEIVGEGKKRIEFKNYFNFNNNNFICLEHHSSEKYKNEGWTEKIDFDYILFTWHGKQKECYMILDAQGLRRWWINNRDNYEKRYNRWERRFGKWDRSSYSIVPVKDLPKDIIIERKLFTDLEDFWKNES